MFFSYVSASKPEISILKSEEEPISGSNLTLECRARGYPVPVVTWYKDQIKLNKTEHTSIFSVEKLSIAKLESGDSGVYTCQALNNMGMDKKHVQINVQEPVTRDSSVTSKEKMSCWKHKTCNTFNREKQVNWTMRQMDYSFNSDQVWSFS